MTYTVTQRIKTVKQPYGGYIRPGQFTVFPLGDGNILNQEEENIHASLVGIAVDYLTRYMLCESAEEAFKISLLGASVIDDLEKAKKLLRKIRGLGNSSIIAACQLARYDVYYRVGPHYDTVEKRNDKKTKKANKTTIENIKTMVLRNLAFFKKHEPIIKIGFCFDGGYTETVVNGDGDFLTKDMLLDLKTSKKRITSKDTLQLLMYYIMGMNSIYKEDFQEVHQIGIINPRLNCVYLLNISDIKENVMQEVAINVIGYSEKNDRINENINENIYDMDIFRNIYIP